jgi:hypothetical protein
MWSRTKIGEIILQVECSLRWKRVKREDTMRNETFHGEKKSFIVSVLKESREEVTEMV